MRYILNPRFDISLRNIEPSHKILNPGFNISWPLYIEHPFDFHLLLERGGSKYHGRDISTPFLYPIPTGEGVQNITSWYINPPSDYHCYCRRGSKYYGCNHWNPPSISNWKGGSKYHGHDTMTHCYGTQEVKKRL